MKFRLGSLIIFAAMGLALAACAPTVVTIAVTAPPETVVITATPAPSPTPTPTLPEPKVLTVCVVGEPDTLYLYGDSHLASTRHVMEALYDGPIDHRAYGRQPVILKKLPRLDDDDAKMRITRVDEGDWLVNAAGEVVTLTVGTRIRPSGCYTAGCEVAFDGGAAWMDRMLATFTLREDVTWADGEPLTAYDSEFAFEVAADPATPGDKHLIERTERYRALDKWRVMWEGLPGFIDDTYYLNFFAPLPRHQLKGRDPADLPQAADTRRKPLGWGAFVVDEWVSDDHITLTPNPHYFRAAEGLPHLDRLVFKITAGAPEVTAGLLSGACDVGTQDANFDPFMPLLMRAEERDLLNVVSAPGSEGVFIDFGIDPVSDYRRADVFDDVRVRQAIAQCIDRQAIVDEVTYGRGVILDSYLPPSHLLYEREDIMRWGYDPFAARTLLEEVGWLDEDGDGVREAQRVEGVPSRTDFEVTLLTPSDDSQMQAAANIVAANLMDCGIRVDVTSRPAWELRAAGPAGPLFGRRFDMTAMTWPLEDTPPCERYLASEIPESGNWEGANITGYTNVDYERACQQALLALPGTSAYGEYHRQAQRIFSEDIPSLPLFTKLRVAVARQRVLNFTMDPTAESVLWHIERLDLRAAQWSN